MTRIVSCRPAFVLPVVILLVMVSVMTCLVILLRADVQSRQVRRQIDATARFHAIRGIRKTVEDWITSTAADSMGELADDTGFVMAIEPADGTRLEIFVFDGQGSMLRTPSGMNDTIREAIWDAQRELIDLVGSPTAAERYLRDAGPAQVSVNEAPEEVIKAVVAASVDDPSKAEALVGSILEARRNDNVINRGNLRNLASAAELDSEERTMFDALVTAETGLWEMVIDVRNENAAAGIGVLARYRALVRFNRNIPSSVGRYERPSSFVGWRTDTVNEFTAVPPEPSVSRDGPADEAWTVR